MLRQGWSWIGQGDIVKKLTTSIDTTAHKGAQRLFVAGLSVGAIYWGAVIRWSESFLLCYVGMELIGSVLHGCRMGCYGACESALYHPSLLSLALIPSIARYHSSVIPFSHHSIFTLLSNLHPVIPLHLLTSPRHPAPPAPIPLLPGLNTNNRLHGQQDSELS